MKENALLLTFAALLLGCIGANGKQLTESFEELTLVDANGNALANAWSWGYGLSNGWKIIDGTIDTGGNGNYTLVQAKGKGAVYTDWYLSSGSTSVNNACVFIPTKVTGQVTVWVRSNLNATSKKTSTITIYEATGDGQLTETVLFFKETEKGNSTWLPVNFNVDDAEGKYLAFNMVYTDIDEFSATMADGSGDSSVTPSLTASVTSLDFGTLEEKGTQAFTVSSNVATTVSFAITGRDAQVFEIVEAPTVLSSGQSATVSVRMSAEVAGAYEATLTVTAGELGADIALKGIWEVKEPDETELETADWEGETFVGYHENDAMPTGWVADGWYIGEPIMLDTPAAVTFDGGTLITPLFEVVDGGTLHFFFSKTAIGWNGYTNKMVISHSTDKKNWTDVAEYDKYEADGIKTVALPESGRYYVRFVTNSRTYLNDFKVLAPEATAVKTIERKQIIHLPFAYDLQGRKTVNQRGMLIGNGKKILRK